MMQPIPLEMFNKTLINFIPYDCLVYFEYDDKTAVFADGSHPYSSDIYSSRRT